MLYLTHTQGLPLNFKCQNFDVSGNRGAPKTKLLSATPKYNFEMKLKPNV